MRRSIGTPIYPPSYLFVVDVGEVCFPEIFKIKYVPQRLILKFPKMTNFFFSSTFMITFRFSCLSNSVFDEEKNPHRPTTKGTHPLNP